MSILNDLNPVKNLCDTKTKTNKKDEKTHTYKVNQNIKKLMRLIVHFYLFLHRTFRHGAHVPHGYPPNSVRTLLLAVTQNFYAMVHVFHTGTLLTTMHLVVGGPT